MRVCRPLFVHAWLWACVHVCVQASEPASWYASGRACVRASMRACLRACTRTFVSVSVSVRAGKAAFVTVSDVSMLPCDSADVRELLSKSRSACCVRATVANTPSVAKSGVQASATATPAEDASAPPHNHADLQEAPS